MDSCLLDKYKAAEFTTLFQREVCVPILTTLAMLLQHVGETCHESVWKGKRLTHPITFFSMW